MREITRDNYVQNREKFILDRCKDKKVLHLGCCSSPDTEFRFSRKNALFQRIEGACSVQQGLDIDQEAIDYLDNIGYSNISYFDLNEPGVVSFNPEVIVFADTLEHLMNLEIALSSLKGLMGSQTELIVTVPNATMLSRVIGNFRGLIQEHEDHKVSFTYSSLRQLLLSNGLTVENIFLSDQINIEREYFKKNKTGFLKTCISFSLKIVERVVRRPVTFFFPLFSECLIMVCKKTKK